MVLCLQKLASGSSSIYSQERYSNRSCSPIDIVQVRFRECCGSLDQTLCLAEICQILRIHYEVKPTLIFVDIKPVYDTVNYNLV
ncbi:hypothetical protein RO3G_01810 [Rhizopus delemar RA 99-880]|uniref:Uncharacterized protein n=1 Tax=Rhizopus delemar (strain RA 99-880 / ATCC MYA-4621 / FGSC 9543 / NRRL 43880) TaxID=246409 RepID=I1BLM6_RHIO9|nr:hypothetical protein RO3G_01810 [Rhizopus delemar RA 99-880]|eukprot:EIE77106.1 hypothetical protein RO3G_01810 [Rhizopus delemar RA 99-880]